MTEPHQDLLRKLHRKDPDAIDTLMDHHGALYKAIVLEYVPDAAGVVPFLAESLDAIQTHIDTFDEQGGDFANWSAGVVHCTALNARRRACANQPELIEKDGLPACTGQFEGHFHDLLAPLDETDRAQLNALLQKDAGLSHKPDPRYAVFNRINSRPETYEKGAALHVDERKETRTLLNKRRQKTHKKRTLKTLAGIMGLVVLIVFSFALVGGAADDLFNNPAKNAFQNPHDAGRTLPTYAQAIDTTHDLDGVKIRPVSVETSAKRIWINYDVQLPPNEHPYGNNEDDFLLNPKISVAGTDISQRLPALNTKPVESGQNLLRMTLVQNLPTPLPSHGSIDFEQKITRMTTYNAETKKVIEHTGNITIAFTTDAKVLTLNTLTVANNKIPYSFGKGRFNISDSDFNTQEGRIEIKHSGLSQNASYTYLKGQDDEGHNIIFAQSRGSNSGFLIQHGTTDFLYEGPADNASRPTSDISLKDFIKPGRQFTVRLYSGGLEGRNLNPITEPFTLTLEPSKPSQ